MQNVFSRAKTIRYKDHETPLQLPVLHCLWPPGAKLVWLIDKRSGKIYKRQK